MSLDERKIRLEKIQKMMVEGINPYPSKFEKKQNLAQAKESKIGAKIKTAGRLMTKREMGKICFCHLQDETIRMQIVLQQEKVGESEYKFFLKNIDLGDFIKCIKSII